MSRERVLVAVVALTLLAGIIAALTAGPAEAKSRRRAGRAARVTSQPTQLPAQTSTTVAPTTTSTAPPTTSVPAASTALSPTTSARRPKPTTSTTVPQTTTTTVAPPAPSSSGGPILFGAATDGGQDLSLLNAFESHAGKKVNLYSYYHSFKYSPNFDAAAASNIRAHGATPMITWEPWDPSASPTSQPAYSLAAIAGGSHDALITRWASQIKTWGQPLWLRFAHEMNSDWYPWAEKVNGNRPGQYVAAWRHVHDIFKQVGATNVVWVWNPNVDFPGATAMSSLYPGDAYVDWVGLDGYNWGKSTSWGAWQTFDQVFGPSLTTLRQITSRPVVIGETASTEVGGDKAQWISQFFASLTRNAAVKAFVWFNLNKETDWRIESSAAAQRAFATGVADPRFRAA